MHRIFSLIFRGAEGEGLTCSFPARRMSADGLTLWSIFSVYGAGAKQGLRAHDQFKLVRPRSRSNQRDNHAAT